MNFRVTSRIASDACRLLAADGEILGQHRAGNVEHEHDVDAARLDLRETLAELRTRQGDDEESQGRRSSARRNFPTRAALVFPSARKLAVDEKVSAAAGPLLPRK